MNEENASKTVLWTGSFYTKALHLFAADLVWAGHNQFSKTFYSKLQTAVNSCYFSTNHRKETIEKREIKIHSFKTVAHGTGQLKRPPQTA